MMRLQPISQSLISKLPLFVLKLAVYSKSSVLTMMLLSLFGLIHGVARVPKNRASAVKSLLKYGVEVFQHGLGTPIQNR
jgi:recombinational DNA repair protein (RecF pathway)